MTTPETNTAILLAVSILAFGVLPAAESLAQELTPRAYWPLPNDSNVAGLAYQRTAGDVVVDLGSGAGFDALAMALDLATIIEVEAVPPGYPFIMDFEPDLQAIEQVTEGGES